MSIDLSVFSKEQKDEILKTLAEEKRAESEKMSTQKGIYEDLKDESVNGLFEFLLNVSATLKDAKAKVFATCEPLLSLKKELYSLSDEDLSKQQSHTFSNRLDTKSVKIGYNIVDGWDEDLVSAAKARVDKWLKSKVNKDNEMFVSLVRDLLNAHEDGKLKASRVMELSNKANEFGDKELIDATDMLQRAYRPQKSSTYVRAKYKNENNQWKWIELSMSQA